MQTSQSLDSLPCEFSSLKNVPKEIFYRGKLSLLTKIKVSIVGARKAYPYSRSITHNLALELSKRGVVVVSGGAMGIDAISHNASFPNTIGVLANGLDIVYPKVNKNLLHKMSESSLLLSEYEDGEKARAYTFVHRNRLVVSLGEVLVIAQADIDSGSMRSAEFALEMGKKIYVLPHRLGESTGTTQLLKDGNAELITDIKEFADMFAPKIVEIEDDFLNFCINSPTYEEAISFNAAKLFEYELLGKIKIINSRVSIT